MNCAALDDLAVYLGKPRLHIQVDDADPLISKIGGRPAWLNEAVVDCDRLVCTVCGRRLFFVAQLYAPISFRRVLYIFGCNSSNVNCLKNSWKVYRSQDKPCEKFQKVIEADPIVEEDITSNGWDADDPFTTSNEWNFEKDSNLIKDEINCIESLLLERNKTVKHNRPSKSAKNNFVSKRNENFNFIQNQDKKNFLYFPAIELENEEEYLFSNEDYSYEETLYKKYITEEKKNESITKSNSDKSDNSSSILSSLAPEGYEQQLELSDRLFLKFQQRVKSNPSQCIRYSYGGIILLPGIVPKDCIPSQCSCGAKRVFELQLMPAIHFFLKVDQYILNTKKSEKSINQGMDWSTAIIWSCPESCDFSNEEQIYVFPSIV